MAENRWWAWLGLNQRPLRCQGRDTSDFPQKTAVFRCSNMRTPLEQRRNMASFYRTFTAQDESTSCLIAAFPIGRTEPPCFSHVGGCTGGAKMGVGDGAASSELKAPFRLQSMSPVVGEQRSIVYRTGAFKPWAQTTPFAGTDKRGLRARDRSGNR